MDFFPVGQFWCPRCVVLRDFVVREGESPTDKDVDIECFVCEYVYSKVVEEFDPKTGALHVDSKGELYGAPVIRPVISQEQRHKARKDLRESTRTDMIRGSGARAQAFAQRKPTKVGS